MVTDVLPVWDDAGTWTDDTGKDQPWHMGLVIKYEASLSSQVNLLEAGLVNTDCLSINGHKTDKRIVYATISQWMSIHATDMLATL